MRRYFVAQLKRCLRYLPVLLCVWLVLGASMLLLTQKQEAAPGGKLTIGVVGTGEDSLFQSVLDALEGLDPTGASMTLQTMTEGEALAALRQGTAAAYIRFPEGFFDAILYGQVKPVEYVSLGGAPDISRMITEELTAVLTRLLTDAQKGIYGTGTALLENGQSHLAGPAIRSVSIEYIKLVLDRDQVYRVQTISLGSLGMAGTLLCGMMVTLCFLLTLPFAPLFVKKDTALERMLCASGCGPLRQVMSQLVAYLCVLLAAALPAVLAASWAAVLPEPLRDLRGLLYLLPVLIMTAGLSLVLYEAVRDLMSGILVNFLASLALCFAGGCLYPIWFFPEAMQRISVCLPSGLAQCWLSGAASGRPDGSYALGLLGCGFVFSLAAVGLRKRKTGKGAA